MRSVTVQWCRSWLTISSVAIARHSVESRIDATTSDKFLLETGKMRIFPTGPTGKSCGSCGSSCNPRRRWWGSVDDLCRRRWAWKCSSHWSISWCPLTTKSTIFIGSIIAPARTGRARMLLLLLLLLNVLLLHHRSFKRSAPVEEHIFIEKMAKIAESEDWMEDGRHVPWSSKCRRSDKRRKRGRWADTDRCSSCSGGGGSSGSGCCWLHWRRWRTPVAQIQPSSGRCRHRVVVDICAAIGRTRWSRRRRRRRRWRWRSFLGWRRFCCCRCAALVFWLLIWRWSVSSISFVFALPVVRWRIGRV